MVRSPISDRPDPAGLSDLVSKAPVPPHASLVAHRVSTTRPMLGLHFPSARECDWRGGVGRFGAVAFAGAVTEMGGSRQGEAGDAMNCVSTGQMDRGGIVGGTVREPARRGGRPRPGLQGFVPGLDATGVPEGDLGEGEGAQEEDGHLEHGGNVQQVG